MAFLARAFLVTGTDTGVGKTAVACGLLLALRDRGLRVAGMKPAETGWNGAGWPDDADALRQASGRNLPMDAVVPYRLRDPLAPAVAAAREGTTIDPLRLDAAFGQLARASDAVVVEGAGGIAVPITEELDYAQLAVRWDLEVLIVCRPGLGTLNHTRLAVDAAWSAGAKVAGLVVNRFPAEPGLAETTNVEWLPRLAGVPVVAVVPDEADAERAQAAARRELGAWLSGQGRSPAPPPAAGHE